MPSTKQYDSNQVTVSYGGHTVQGYADGTFVNVERNNDGYGQVSGADGEVTINTNNDKTGTVTITLMQTSESNAILAAFYEAQELASAAGAPLVLQPLLVRNELTGLDLHTAAEAFITKPSAVGYGKESTEREWVIGCPKLNTFAGGK